MWQNPFAHPDPRAALERASVWFTAYPLSFVTRRGRVVPGRARRPGAVAGVPARSASTRVHTGPVKQAGGLNGRRLTPSVDGHFDRISMQVDPAFGTEEQFRTLCATAAEYEGTVIDDIVPGHTGKGADFRLAEMGYGDYPGIYHMVSIAPDDWHLLPDVPDGRDCVNLDAETEARLERAGYIIGRLQRVIFYEPGVKETNWSATRAVTGVDGVERRWVYLHYFKEGQPSINWLDPSFAGMRLVIGDALHALADLGAGGLRLDANGFLGAEKTAEDEPAWSEGHPLSEAANHLIASMVRKMGGFSFQELNLSMDDIKAMGESGADLSYDFVNRPAYHHALVTGDTEFLRLTLNLALRARASTPPRSCTRCRTTTSSPTSSCTSRRATATTCSPRRRGDHRRRARRARPRRPQRRASPGRHAPYNRTFTTNGIACTTATVIARHARASATSREITEAEREQIKRRPPAAGDVQRAPAGRLRALRLGPGGDADRRRGRGRRPDRRRRHALDQPRRARPARRRRARAARAGCRRPRSLYGTLPEQLADPASFASAAARGSSTSAARYGIATAIQSTCPTSRTAPSS